MTVKQVRDSQYGRYKRDELEWEEEQIEVENNEETGGF